MDKQAVNLNAEIVDLAGIVKTRNCYRIGKWSLLYNEKKNPATFEFSDVKPRALRIAVSGSTSWVRLVRPIDAPLKSGVYSVSLTLRSLTDDPRSKYEPYVFISRKPGMFEKHSRLTLRDGHYKTKLHMTKGGPSFWIGFETLEQNIELLVDHIRLDIAENSVDLAQGLAECRTVDLPLVSSAPKCRHYTVIDGWNREYQSHVSKNELPFLLEYAAGLRRVEMPETFLRLVRFLVVKHAMLDRKHQTLLANQVRNALMVSHDEALVELIVEHCPDMLPALDLSDEVLAKIAGLDAIDSGAGTHALDKHAYFTHQDEPGKLFGLVHRESVKDATFLRTNPSAYCALANAYASRPGGQSRYVAYLNKYLAHHGLPLLEEADTTDGRGLGALRFAPPAATVEQGPLVSVMMSAHEAGETIGYAIESLLAQTYRNIEVLVCDDLSGDDTLEVARRCAAKDARVRVFQSASNQGTYNIRNDLIREAKGEFLTFQDSDDFAMPCRIEEQLAMLADERKAVCFSHWLRVRPDGSVVYFHDGHISRFCVVSAMAHRSVFERMPPFRSALVAADTEFYELCKCLLGDEEIAILRRPLLLGLWGEGSLTKRKNLTADHSGYVAPRRRAYAEIAARQRLLGDAIVPDEQVEDTLRELGIYREPAGLAAEALDPAARGTAEIAADATTDVAVRAGASRADAVAA